MNQEIVPSDVALLDLLRQRESLTVAELSTSMSVTATAVRQRLTRLMAQGYVDRVATKAGRGRPTHRYELTTKGRHKTGANFADLAIALWQEVRAIKDPDVQRGLIQRVAKHMAKLYADQIVGDTVEQRMESLSQLLGRRRIPCAVDQSGDLPVLIALACPYPDLAEQDRSICAMERILFSEILGKNVRLRQCRLDGDLNCTFEM